MLFNVIFVRSVFKDAAFSTGKELINLLKSFPLLFLIMVFQTDVPLIIPKESSEPS